MSSVIPGFFVALGAAALLAALFFLWQSLRAAFGVVTLGGAEALDLERARLLERKAALLDGLSDLRFEHDAGKIDAADFAVVDAQLREEAKDVLKALDGELEPYRAQADAIIEAYLAGNSSAAAEPESSPSEASGAAATSARKAHVDQAPVDDARAVEVVEAAPRAATQECAACHTVNDDDATFCKKCGRSLTTEPEGPEEKS